MKPRYLTIALILALVACEGATSPTDTQMPPGDDPMAGGALAPGLRYAGSFHPVVHNGSGTAEVYVLDDGSRELRFEDDFATSDGPKLEVWLVKADDAQDSETVLGADYISLGELKSPTGAQSYDIPAGTDLGTYRSVVVWCVAFDVNFTTAPLMME